MSADQNNVIPNDMLSYLIMLPFTILSGHVTLFTSVNNDEFFNWTVPNIRTLTFYNTISVHDQQHKVAVAFCKGIWEVEHEVNDSNDKSICS